MMLTDDELSQRLDLYQELGSYSAAAEKLGVDESNVRRSVKAAVRRNLGGSALGSPLPPGYTMGQITALVGEDGHSRLEWQHRLPEAEAIENMFEEMTRVMGLEITPLPVVNENWRVKDTNLLTLYPVVDVHLGLYAWGKESGQNYDLNIAKEQFQASVTQLMALSPMSNEALIVVLGDFFHADNNDAQTAKSHNHLDVDGRHDKVLHLGTELIIWYIDMALQKHGHVSVHVSRGNHDPYASKALGMALWFRYQDNPRVTIDRSPLDLWTTQWGQTMLSFTHGDNVKAEDMPGVMAAFEPTIWGSTTYRYAYSGHFHKSKTGPKGDEKHGAIWEVLPAFTAKDEWNRSMGHSSLRTIVSKTFHVEEGLKFTNTVNV